MNKVSAVVVGIGVLLIILGSLTYLEAGGPGSTVFAKALGILPGGSSLTGSSGPLGSAAAAALTQQYGSNTSLGTSALLLAIVGVFVVIFSGRIEEAIVEQKEKRGTERERGGIASMASVFAVAVISWLLITGIYYMGYHALWSYIITIIVAFLATAYLVGLVSASGNKSIAFFAFILFVMLSAFLGSLLSSFVASFVQNNVYDVTYAAIGSLLTVIFAYMVFSTQIYESATTGLFANIEKKVSDMAKQETDRARSAVANVVDTRPQMAQAAAIEPAASPVVQEAPKPAVVQAKAAEEPKVQAAEPAKPVQQPKAETEPQKSHVYDTTKIHHYVSRPDYGIVDQTEQQHQKKKSREEDDRLRAKLTARISKLRSSRKAKLKDYQLKTLEATAKSLGTMNSAELKHTDFLVSKWEGAPAS